jgi:hypothetical protein
LLQKIGILNALSRSLPADEEEPKAAHAGLLGAWLWKHDPERYAIDNYGKALEHLNNGAPFQNTNLPRGYVHKPWTIETLLNSTNEQELELNSDWV